LIKIDLKKFFKLGEFDFVKLGKTKEWLTYNFPYPDDHDEDSLESASIWRYGNVEFHFDNDKLTMIFSDYLYGLEGGEGLELDLWFLTSQEPLTLIDVMIELHKEKIEYRKENDSLGDVKLRLKSGVTLFFGTNFMEDDEDVSENEYLLEYFAFG